jgi:ankyrin repeat protein
VELQLAHICKLKSQRSIDEVLSNRAVASVEAINALYAKILAHIRDTNPSDYEVAVRTLRLIMCLHEAMSPTALLAATTIISSGEECSLKLSELLSICSHLVTHDQELDTLRFAHASVREYLISLPDFTVAKAHSAAAQSCLAKCIEGTFPDLATGVSPAKDFDCYAAMYWAMHYNASDDNDRRQLLEMTLEGFVLSEEELMPPFHTWIDAVTDITESMPMNHPLYKSLTAVQGATISPLFTVCVYGLETLIQALQEDRLFDVNEKNERGHTGIYLAAAMGHTNVVERLLQLDADVTIECGHHRTALHAACANGHAEVVKVLLRLPDDVVTAHSVNSALQTSIRNGHENVAILLLKKTGGFATVAITSESPEDELALGEQTASNPSRDALDEVFDAAAGMGFVQLMSYLHCHPKSLIAEKKKLPPKGADKSYKIVSFRKRFKNGGLPEAAIATAAFYGQNEIIQFCVEKGLDIEKEGPFGTPLRVSSLMGHDSTVRILLTLGADVNTI